MQTTSKVKPKDSHDKPKAQRLIAEYDQKKGERSNFESYWQSLHDYFYIEASNINRTYLYFVLRLSSISDNCFLISSSCFRVRLRTAR